MKIKGKCKLCHRELELECDDSYAELGDPFKLAGMVCCNRCADQRSKYAGLHRQIGNICHGIVATPIAKRYEALKEAIEPIRRLTRTYAETFQEFNCGHSVVWDEAFPQMILDHPDRWWKILEDYRRHTAKHWQQPTQMAL